MKYKNIQAMHEIRLTLTQVVVPLVVTSAMILSNEDVRKSIENVAGEVCLKVTNFIDSVKEKRK